MKNAIKNPAQTAVRRPDIVNMANFKAQADHSVQPNTPENTPHSEALAFRSRLLSALPNHKASSSLARRILSIPKES